MKTKPEYFDTMNYEDVLKAALPNAQIRRVDNFDDVHFGWEISPEPGHLIVFKVEMNNEMKIFIERHSINYFAHTSEHKRMFNGNIPSNENYEPDFHFVEQLLKNFHSIA